MNTLLLVDKVRSIVILVAKPSFRPNFHGLIWAMKPNHTAQWSALLIRLKLKPISFSVYLEPKTRNNNVGSR